MTLQIYDLASGIYAVAKRSWASAPTIKNTRLLECRGGPLCPPVFTAGVNPCPTISTKLSIKCRARRLSKCRFGWSASAHPFAVPENLSLFAQIFDRCTRLCLASPRPASASATRPYKLKSMCDRMQGRGSTPSRESRQPHREGTEALPYKLSSTFI